eukprot:4059879-Pleurochrysis_carterae.AAC.1
MEIVGSLRRGQVNACLPQRQREGAGATPEVGYVPLTGRTLSWLLLDAPTVEGRVATENYPNVTQSAGYMPQRLFAKRSSCRHRGRHSLNRLASRTAVAGPAHNLLVVTNCRSHVRPSYGSKTAPESVALAAYV